MTTRHLDLGCGPVPRNPYGRDELYDLASDPHESKNLLVPPAEAKEMVANGKYTYWRIAIGADGTWHSFRK